MNILAYIETVKVGPSIHSSSFSLSHFLILPPFFRISRNPLVNTKSPLPPHGLTKLAHSTVLNSTSRIAKEEKQTTKKWEYQQVISLPKNLTHRFGFTMQLTMLVLYLDMTYCHIAVAKENAMESLPHKVVVLPNSPKAT